ncbi:hypothetical protein [Campylobacter curvus]|uniref:hypothetical protein n=1 Tax=Campylobacter curvus TaxID=200 RepID=UPI00146FF75B|nr:hypothetical protein [Campylobacter curvus]
MYVLSEKAKNKILAILLKNKANNVKQIFLDLFLKSLPSIPDEEISDEKIAMVCEALQMKFNLTMLNSLITKDDFIKIENSTNIDIDKTQQHFLLVEKLQQDLKSRYRHDLDLLPRNCANRLIVDNIMVAELINTNPQYLYQFLVKSNKESLYLTRNNTRSLYVLSRFLGQFMNIPVLNIETQLNLLGYSLTEVKKDLLVLKNKKLNIALLGYGGVNCNFLEYLKWICEETNVEKIFNNIQVYEKDELELHNVFRMNSPNILNTSYNSSIGISFPSRFIKKLNTSIFEPINNDDDDDKTKIYKLHLIDTRYFKTLVNKQVFVYPIYYTPDVYNIQSNTIYIGAIDMQIRERLESFDVPYLCNTHQNNTIDITNKPHIVSSLIRESYGEIDLVPFFFNMLDMTVQLVKIMAHTNRYEADHTYYRNTFKNIKNTKRIKYNIPTVKEY